MAIHGIYFSPTSNTKTYIEAMASHLSDESVFHDLTVNGDSKMFTEDDFVIIGAPVYAGRIPMVAFERFQKLHGSKTPCVIVVTYGNRDFDDALVELEDLMINNGFVIYGGCALIGKHTYGDIQVDRPNADDLCQVKDFIYQIYQRQTPCLSIIPGNRPYKEISSNKGRFKPSTNEKCIQCGICFKNCPVTAISNDMTSILDHCISCFRCIKICPLGCKEMITEEYASFAKMFTEKLKERKENQFFM